MCGLLGLSPAELVARVGEIVVDWGHDSISPENQVLIQLGVDPSTPPEPAAVRWFHATRAIPGTKFEEGLLPTLEAMPKVWEALGLCAAEWLSASEWSDYQRSFSGHLDRKRMVPGWQGPFAFLVKDAALHRHEGHKDFTRMCETAEDICVHFQRVHGYSLRQVYEELARPCLVVFTWPGARAGTVRAAANYVYRSLRGIECGLHCNTNFSGGGKPVPFSLIDCVEWL